MNHRHLTTAPCQRLARAGFALLLSWAMLGASQGQSLLNVDFGIGTQSAKTGAAAIGEGPADYWNLYTRDDGAGGYRPSGVLTNLRRADGTASAVGLTVSNAPGAWGTGSADPMFGVYLYPFDGGNIVVSVTGLASGGYDLYLYAHGLLDGENGVVQVSSGPQDYGTQTTSTVSGWSATAWQVGQQYVRFENVAVTAGQPLEITVKPGSTGLAVLNGMQISARSSALTPVTTDLWDIRQGTVITAYSGVRAGFDPRDALGGTLGTWEPGGVVFADGMPDGTVHFLEWRTPAPVTVGSFVLFAAGDGAVYLHEREFGRFRLLAKSAGSGVYDRVLYEYTATHPFPLLDTQSGALLAVPVPAFTAQEFRAEFVQWDAGRGYDGPRVIELDGLPPAYSDGIPDGWREQYFGPGHAADPRAAAVLDPDNDGANNYQEYLGGTDPLDAESVQRGPNNVTTFAGSTSGERNGFRTEAQFNYIWGMAFDPAGRLWIPEGNGVGFDQPTAEPHRLRIIDAAGQVSVLAGAEHGLVDGPLDRARFSGPFGVVFDSRGNAFVLDMFNHRIRKIDPFGQVTTFAGSTRGYRDGPGIQAQFDLPHGLAIDPQDNLFVADWFNLRIRKVTPQGEVSTYSGSSRGAQDGPRLEATYDGPVDVAVDPTGILYVSDWANGRIRKIDPAGMVTTLVSGLTYTETLSLGRDGSLYCYVASLRALNKYGAAGELLWSWSTPEGWADGPIGTARFGGRLTRVLELADGNLLVGDDVRVRLLQTGPVPLLTVSPPGADFVDSVTVTLASPVPHGVICYTLDGSVPLVSSPHYQLPLTLTESVRLQARVFVNGTPVSDVVSATFTRPTGCAPAAAGLVGWWPGEGSAADIAGDHAGEMKGGVAFLPGLVGQAFSLDGLTASLAVPASPELHVQSFTWEGWVRPVSLGYQVPIALFAPNRGPGGVLLAHGVSPDGARHLPGALYAELRGHDSAGAAVTRRLGTAAGVLAAHAWSHVALTYDQASGWAHLYADGERVSSTNLGAVNLQTAYPLRFGFVPEGNTDGWAGHRFQGRLDELGLYARALESAEVAAIGAAGALGKCAPEPPVLVTEPASQTVAVGSLVTFRVVARSALPLRYAWSFDEAPLAGATNATLVLGNVQPAQGGIYRVTVSNRAGSVTSAAATLTVTVPPGITLQPVSQRAVIGAAVTFRVAATGPGPLAYQWFRDGVVVPGGIAPTLILNDVQLIHAGQYTVRVSNASGVIVSEPATLAVGVAVLEATAGLGGVTFSVSGRPGLDYAIEASHDLSQWELVATVLSAPVSWQYADPDAALYDRRFYRVRQL